MMCDNLHNSNICFRFAETLKLSTMYQFKDEEKMEQRRDKVVTALCWLLVAVVFVTQVISAQ